MNPSLILATISEKPTFRSNLPFREHKHTVHVVSNVTRYFKENWPWKNSCDYDQYIAQDLDIFIPLTLPDALDDRIEHIAKLSTLMFLLDDVHDYMSDEDKEAMQALFKHFPAFALGTQTPAPDDRPGWIVADILSHFRSDENLSEEASYLGKKACEHTVGLFSASTSSKHFMITIEYPTMESYLAYRFRDAGVLYVPEYPSTPRKNLNAVFRWSFSLIRWGCNIFIPDYIMDDPNFTELEKLYGIEGILLNDIFSFRREVIDISKRSKDGTVSGIVNSIPIVMQERGLNQVDAMRHVEDTIRQVEHDILEVEVRLKLGYTGQDRQICERYSEALKLTFGGNAYWSTFCGRYNK